MLKIKIVYANDTRLWKFIKGKHTYQDLIVFVSLTFHLKSSKNAFHLQFEDDELDRITISTDIDFQDAVECAVEEKRKSLKIYVQNGKTIANSNTNSNAKEEIYSCSELRELVLDFLQNTEISKILPDLIQQIVNELKKKPQSSAIIMENKMRSILKQYEIIVNHKLYPKIDSMLNCFAKQIEKHSQILLNFNEDTISSWIPHLTNVLLQFFQYSMDDISNTGPMFHAFVPTWCAFMNQKCPVINANEEPAVHTNVTCDSCQLSPIRGPRYKCCCCPNYDLCEKCEAMGKHDSSHPLIKFQQSMNCAQRPFVGLHEMMMNFGHGPHHWFGHHWRRCRRKNQRPPLNQQKSAPAQTQMEGHMQYDWQGNMHHPWFNNIDNAYGQDFHSYAHPYYQQIGNGWQQNNWRHRRNKSSIPRMNGNARKLMAEFVCDVTLQDRSNFPMDTVLTKTWKMRNNGNCEWGTNVELVFFKGNEALTLEHRYPVLNAMPGQEVEISAVVKTPKTEGRYCAYYRLQKNGTYFGPRVWVDIFAVGFGDIPFDIEKQNKKEIKKTKKLMKKQLKAVCKLSKLEANESKNNKKFIEKQNKIQVKINRTHEKIRHMVDTFENLPTNVQQNVQILQENFKNVKQKVMDNIEYVHQGIIQGFQDISQFNDVSNDQNADVNGNVKVNADELPMLEEIANVVIDEVHRESAIPINAYGKPKVENFSCVCGSLMVLTTPFIAYQNATVAVDCDVCGKQCQPSDCIYHCPRDRQALEHPLGYDLCQNCMEYQMIVRLTKKEEQSVQNLTPSAPPLYIPEVDDIIEPVMSYVQAAADLPLVDANAFIDNGVQQQQPMMSTAYNNDVHDQQFVYANALKQICSMGFRDDDLVRALLLENKGEVQRVVQLLLG